jgi:hypothetical protein
MASACRLIVLAALGAALFAPSAGATTPPAQRPGLPYSVGTTHILVHYTADPTDSSHITQTQAADLAAKAEVAYTSITSWGFAAPLADGVLGGDSRTDLYVADLSTHGSFATYTYYDGGGSASFDVDPNIGMDQFQIAAAVWSVVGSAMWPASDSWFAQSTAAWAASKVGGYVAPDPTAIGPWNESLDCQEAPTPSGGWTQNCDTNLYNGSGESRWPLWQYLTEKYGVPFLTTVYADGNAGDTGVQAVIDAVVSKGDSFNNVFSAWAAANMSGGYTAAGLQNLIPLPAATIKAGTIAGTNSTTVTVNHLSTRFVAITRGDVADTGPCYGATLNVSVALPSGSGAVPYFWWPPDGLGKAQALTVSGGTASITVPWDTCYWSKWNAAVSLPNPSTTADSQSYTVSTTMTIDKSTILSATTPPGTVTMPGTVISVPTTDSPPSIYVVGPLVIRLSAGDRVLRLIVTSDGPGKLTAALGSVVLGTAYLRTGHNDVRYQLSATALSTLRRIAVVNSGVLTLTPLSPQGATGAAIVRQLTVTPAKAKAKPKAKKKPVAKPKKHASAR